jgi:hypothetical protein
MKKLLYIGLLLAGNSYAADEAAASWKEQVAVVAESVVKPFVVGVGSGITKGVVHIVEKQVSDRFDPEEKAKKQQEIAKLTGETTIKQGCVYLANYKNCLEKCKDPSIKEKLQKNYDEIREILTSSEHFLQRNDAVLNHQGHIMKTKMVVRHDIVTCALNQMGSLKDGPEKEKYTKTFEQEMLAMSNAHRDLLLLNEVPSQPSVFAKLLPNAPTSNQVQSVTIILGLGIVGAGGIIKLIQ